MNADAGHAPAPLLAPRARTATLLLVGSLAIMAATAVSPSLPAIEARFAGTTPDAALLTRMLVSLPALFIVCFAPLAGRIIDRYGRRRLLLAAVFLYAIGGASGLLLDSLPALLAGRALLGVGVAGIMTTATALAGDYYSGAARDRFMGLQNSAMGFMGLLYLTGGGLLAALHWRAPFAIYGLALLLLPAIARWIAEPMRLQPAPANAATPGATLARPGPLIALLFAAAVVNSILFYIGPTQLPYLLQSFGPDAPLRSGLALGMMTLCSGLSSLVYGHVRRRLGLLGSFSLGFGLLALGFLLVGAAQSYSAVLVAMACTGAGIGTLMPSFAVTAMTAAPPAMRGRIAGGLTASIFLGHFISPLVSQPLIAAAGYPGSFHNFGLAAGVMSACALVALLYRRRAAGDRDNSSTGL